MGYKTNGNEKQKSVTEEIARGSEWTREQMETRSRSRSPESADTKSSRGKKKK